MTQDTAFQNWWRTFQNNPDVSQYPPDDLMSLKRIAKRAWMAAAIHTLSDTVDEATKMLNKLSKG